MADLTLYDEARRAVSDEPKVAFNETVADGTNAAWRLTNAPVELASDGVFVSGAIQQTFGVVSTLKAAVARQDYELVLNADTSLFAVGDQIALDVEPNPLRFSVLATDSGKLTLSRRLTKDYAAGVNIYRVSPTYAIDYEAGIIYFTSTPSAGARLACKFRYTKYSDDVLAGYLADATNAVSLDIGGTASSGEINQRVLIMLKLRELILRNKMSDGAGSAIKIRQGSTQLDLTGATATTRQELESLCSEYKRALLNYWQIQQDDALGTAIVGRQEYIDASAGNGSSGSA